jgi:hypothetical protein
MAIAKFRRTGQIISAARLPDGAAVANAGGAVVMPKTEIAPIMGWIAVFKDTKGNMMGFHEPPKRPAKKAAKKKAAKKRGR